MTNSSRSSVYQAIYKSAETGSQSVEDVLPMVSDNGLREVLLKHKKEYERLSDEAESRLAMLGESVKEPGVLAKAGMKLGIEMNTALNTSSSHIAEMLINGSTMGITNITKIMNGYPDAQDGVKSLAQRFIDSERENIENMKKYLQ